MDSAFMHRALELVTMTSSAFISSTMEKGFSTTGMSCSRASCSRCLRVMPGRISSSVGAVCSTPSFSMEMLLWAHSVTRLPRWSTASSQPRSTARWLASTLGIRFSVLMLHILKRMSSMEMSL